MKTSILQIYLPQGDRLNFKVSLLLLSGIRTDADCQVSLLSAIAQVAEGQIAHAVSSYSMHEQLRGRRMKRSIPHIHPGCLPELERWQGSGKDCSQGQFARVVKGVDLRSTAGNCAWVRTPQLTGFMSQSKCGSVRLQHCSCPDRQVLSIGPCFGANWSTTDEKLRYSILGSCAPLTYLRVTRFLHSWCDV